MRVQVYFKYFLFVTIYFFLAGQDSCYHSVVVLSVGLHEWKLTTAHPILTIMEFKNILRTFEAEIL